MNVPPLGFMELKDDREQLIGFLWWLQQFLDLLMKETRESTTDTPLFSRELPDDIHDAIWGAWEELNHRRKAFNEAADNLKTVPIPTLARAGLTGAELGLKFRVLRWIRGRFSSRQSPTWLRRLIKAVDDILDSIASVNPIAHGIKEFKDALSSLTGE